MAVKKKPRKPMSDQARAAASERMRKLNEAKRVKKEYPAQHRFVGSGAICVDCRLSYSMHDPEYQKLGSDEKRSGIYETLEFEEHVCQWLPGQYRAHDGGGLRLTDVYCPVGKHWGSVDA